MKTKTVYVPAKAPRWIAAQPLKQQLIAKANMIGKRKRLTLTQVTKLMMYGVL